MGTPQALGHSSSLLARSAPPPGPGRAFVRRADERPPAPARDSVDLTTEADAPPRGWMSRTAALGMAGLSLLGAVGLGAGRAMADEARPVASQSRVLPTPDVPAPSGFLLAQGTVPSGVEAAAESVALPQPTPLSRARGDRVEINARIEKVAERVGVPADLVKAVAWQESTWTHTRKGELTRQANRDAATGEVRSVDSGIMQINDRAHPHAYPKASTLDGNLEFGSRFLASLLERYGSEGIWRYNGNPEYGTKLLRHLRVQPWNVPVLRDHLRALRAEEAALRVSIPKAEKALGKHQERVQAARAEADRLAAGPAQARARKTLETREKKAAEAAEALQRDQARLAALPGEIEAATRDFAAESTRVEAEESREYREQADALAGRALSLEKDLKDLRAQVAGVLTRLGKIAAPGREAEVQTLRTEADALRQDLGARASAWHATATRLQGKRRQRLGTLEKDLAQALREQGARKDAVRDLQTRLKALR